MFVSRRLRSSSYLGGAASSWRTIGKVAAASSSSFAPAGATAEMQQQVDQQPCRAWGVLDPYGHACNRTNSSLLVTVRSSSGPTSDHIALPILLLLQSGSRFHVTTTTTATTPCHQAASSAGCDPIINSAAAPTTIGVQATTIPQYLNKQQRSVRHHFAGSNFSIEDSQFSSSGMTAEQLTAAGMSRAWATVTFLRENQLEPTDDAFWITLTRRQTTESNHVDPPPVLDPESKGPHADTFLVVNMAHVQPLMVTAASPMRVAKGVIAPFFTCERRMIEKHCRDVEGLRGDATILSNAADTATKPTATTTTTQFAAGHDDGRLYWVAVGDNQLAELRAHFDKAFQRAATPTATVLAGTTPTPSPSAAPSSTSPSAALVPVSLCGRNGEALQSTVFVNEASLIALRRHLASELVAAGSDSLGDLAALRGHFARSLPFTRCGLPILGLGDAERDAFAFAAALIVTDQQKATTTTAADQKEATDTTTRLNASSDLSTMNHQWVKVGRGGKVLTSTSLHVSRDSPVLVHGTARPEFVEVAKSGAVHVLTARNGVFVHASELVLVPRVFLLRGRRGQVKPVMESFSSGQIVALRAAGVTLPDPSQPPATTNLTAAKVPAIVFAAKKDQERGTSAPSGLSFAPAAVITQVLRRLPKPDAKLIRVPCNYTEKPISGSPTMPLLPPPQHGSGAPRRSDSSSQVIGVDHSARDDLMRAIDEHHRTSQPENADRSPLSGTPPVATTTVASPTPLCVTFEPTNSMSVLDVRDTDEAVAATHLDDEYGTPFHPRDAQVLERYRIANGLTTYRWRYVPKGPVVGADRSQFVTLVTHTGYVRRFVPVANATPSAPTAAPKPLCVAPAAV